MGEQESEEKKAAEAEAVMSPDKAGDKQPGLKRKFIRCSSLATVTHLKKYIAKKLLSATDKYKDIDVMCNDEKLYKDHTLKFVYVTRWRTKDPPLKIQFFPRDKSQSSQDQDQEMTENNKAEIKSSA